MATVDSVASSLGIQQTSSATVKSSSSTTDNLTLEFEDYLKIIVAQLQNQDMTNPTDTSDFINQMVQYSSIQIMQEMNTLSQNNYAMNFIGKEVVISETDSSGNISTKSGVVDGVSLYYDEPVVIVDNTEYPLSSVMIATTAKSE
jgi:flagellar basal-body rod modification protein FlgD